MAPFYQYNTKAQARQQIANRLYDPTMVFYTGAEIDLYLTEALRTFNAYAQYWKAEFTFPPTENVQWYDLTQVPNTLRPYTVTDQNLYTLMEYHLLEPVAGNFPATGPSSPWTGTKMFSINDLMNAVQRRRDEILSVTGCSVTQSTVPLTPNITRTILPENVLDVRRVAYFALSGGSGYGEGGYGNGPYGGNSIIDAFPLYRDDVWAFQAFESNWTTNSAGTPSSYAMSSQPPISFDVDTPPTLPGNYELITVNAGPILTTQTATLLGIPDDFSWVLKWGALADLFSKQGEAKDELRAQYCNKRYQQGMALLLNAPAALTIRINNLPLWMDAARSADEYNSSWQAVAAGVPVDVYTAGLNLIALSPKPDATVLDVTASVVQNAPIPVQDSDFVQVSQDDYDVIIDYAQHIALLKNGGEEFTATAELYGRFVKQASLYNRKLNEMGEFQSELYGNSQKEEVFNPRLAPVPSPDGDQ